MTSWRSRPRRWRASTPAARGGRAPAGGRDRERAPGPRARARAELAASKAAARAEAADLREQLRAAAAAHERLHAAASAAAAESASLKRQLAEATAAQTALQQKLAAAEGAQRVAEVGLKERLFEIEGVKVLPCPPSSFTSSIPCHPPMEIREPLSSRIQTVCGLSASECLMEASAPQQRMAQPWDIPLCCGWPAV